MVWKVYSQKNVVENPYITVRKEVVELPGHGRGDYFIHTNDSWASCLPITPDNKVILVKLYKHGIKDVVLELPAGIIDPGESALAAAERELREETGYTAERFELVHRFINSGLRSDGYCSFYIAHNVRKTCIPTPEPTENITIVEVCAQEFRKMLQRGELAEAPFVGGAYACLDHLGLL